MKKKLYYFLLVLLTIACSSTDKKNSSNEYTLVPTEQYIRFPLDNSTYDLNNSELYIDPATGKRYWYFQNKSISQLLIYEERKDTCKLVKKINFRLEGPEAVKPFWDFAVRNPNEIYLTTTYTNGVCIADSTGKLIHYYNGDKEELDFFIPKPTSDIIGNSIYYPLYINHKIPVHERLKKSPICAVVDMDTKQIHTLPFSYFDITQEEHENYFNFNMVRCYNENQKTFVYSLTDTEYLFQTDLLHTNFKKITLKSKYMPTKKLERQVMHAPAGRDESVKRRLKEGTYRSIYYDKQNRVYYRVVNPPTDIPEGIKPMDFLQFDGHSFTIMVLDEEFNVLCEYVLPRDTYNSTPMFVDNGGLYINETHFLNPDYNESIYPMRRFELVKK